MNNIVPIKNGMNFSGVALKKARLLRGKSMDELGKELDLSQQMISKYEKGTSVPSFVVLNRLSEILGFPISYFYTNQELSDVSNGFYRKGSSVTKKAKHKVVEKVSFFSSILSEISNVVQLPTYSDPVDIKRTKDFSEISLSYIEKIAMNLRNKFEFGDGPLLNLTGFLESLGIFIVFTDLESEKIDAYTVFEDEIVPIIMINSKRTSSSRIRFNLAHEFAHILFHREYIKKYENGVKHSRIEIEANFFASCFLVPENGLLEDMSAVSLQHFIVLKEHWHVSIAALIYRANQCGFISELHTLHLRQQLSRNKWRITEPLDDVIKIEYPHLIEQALTIYSEQKKVNAIDAISNKLRLFPEFINDLLFGYTVRERKSKFGLKLV